MSTLRLRSVCPQLALKLGELEVGTALLDRDTRHGRAALMELGLEFPPAARHAFIWRRAVFTFFNLGSTVLRTADRIYGRGARVVGSPRVANALRIASVWLIEGFKGLSVACAMVVAFTIAILLVAPPD
jgi:hypothetical protein